MPELRPAMGGAIRADRAWGDSSDAEDLHDKPEPLSGQLAATGWLADNHEPARIHGMHSHDGVVRHTTEAEVGSSKPGRRRRRMATP